MSHDVRTGRRFAEGLAGGAPGDAARQSGQPRLAGGLGDVVSRPWRVADIANTFGPFHLDARDLVADTSIGGRERLIMILERACAKYGATGLADPPRWTFCPAIHAAMHRIIRAERAELSKLIDLSLTEL